MLADRRITLEGFLKAFQSQDQNQPDHPFCFILGAGASKPSGIRTGAELARHFIDEIHEAENFADESLQDWATGEHLRIANFSLDRAAEYYPELYQRKFGEHLDQGYAFLEKEMEDREPSYGYSVLAWMLAETAHKVVITTNFDNLVADALSIHSATFPRVVGHDSLAGFVQAALRRPLIAKIHGDLGFTPRNTPEEVAQLSSQWRTALRRVLERFTPIVIGYGGNDGSLMGTLENLPDGVPESIYWCQREGTTASDRVVSLIERRKGRLVVIPGFDELMLKIQDHMCSLWGTPDLLAEMERRQRQRENTYKEQRDKIGASLAVSQTQPRPKRDQGRSRDPETLEDRDLADAAIRILAPKEGEKPWWQWFLEAERETDLVKREVIFREALEALPKSAPLLGGYASFLFRDRNDPNRAEPLYQQAIDLAPKDAELLGDYAIFLSDYRRDFDRAEAIFKQAIEADPTHAYNLANYASFLADDRNDYDKAEEFYERAIAAEPDNPHALGTYAMFLSDDRKDIDRAEDVYKRALEADPKYSSNLTYYAIFLTDKRKDLDRAEQLHKRAITLDAKSAFALSEYASFLADERKDLDLAEEFFKRAVSADPNHAKSLVSYADFLAEHRLDFDRADQFYQRAVEADPNDVNTLILYANFLTFDRKDFSRAEEIYQRIIRLAPRVAAALGSYALFLENVRKDFDQADTLFQRAIEIDPGDPINLTNYAVFLAADRKDFDRAAEMHRRAIEANPMHVDALGAYATFLAEHKNDFVRAEELYKRAIEINPNDANALGNYGGFLLSRGRSKEASDFVARAQARLAKDDVLGLELSFYNLAHGVGPGIVHLAELGRLLRAGVRSRTWSFARNIDQIERQTGQRATFLRALAKVINDEAEPSSLSQFPEWQVAETSRGG